MGDLLRLWRTIRPLKSRQISARILNRIRPRPFPKPGALPARKTHRSWIESISVDPTFFPPDQFTFFGQTEKVLQPDDWNQGTSSRLWFYNLHYFNDLKRFGAEEFREAHEELIARWISQVPVLQGPGWEPYPLSLRIVNWIRWALCDGDLSRIGRESLVRQLRLLAARPEYHLLGNHLLANAMALFFGGLFFDDEEAEGWRKLGTRLLIEESNEQILEDGGHFERTPVYHALILESFLDVINLAQVYDLEPPEGLQENIKPMFEWLQVMTHGDGAPAYFNDTARGVAPRFETLLQYALRLGIELPSRSNSGLQDLSTSGYFRLDDETGRAVIFDAAPVGAPYLLGHGHADTLSFEFSLGSVRVVVNGGVSTYEPGEKRLMERGTLAHSTITLDCENSSEIWDAFRCGRVARVFDRESGHSGSRLWAAATHDGYRDLAVGPVLHRRKITLTPEQLEIEDRLIPSNRLKRPIGIESHFLFNPKILVEETKEGYFQLQLPNGKVLMFEHESTLDWHIRKGSYAVSFGVSETTLVLAGLGQLREEACFRSCIRIIANADKTVN
jgi:uncharacterized heparinase superfamily protein